YLQIQGTHVQMSILQAVNLTGDFTLQQVTTSAGSQISIAAANVHLGLGDGSRDLVTVDGAAGFFVVTPSGLAGSLSGTAAVTVPGVSLSGTFKVAINTTGAAVSQQVMVGGSTLALDLPAGPFVRVEGTGVSLAVSGQTLTGDFAFEQTTA